MDDINILRPYVLFDLDTHLTIIEPPTFNVTQLDTQEACDLFSQRFVTVAAEDQYIILQLLRNILAEVGVVVVEFV